MSIKVETGQTLLEFNKKEFSLNKKRKCLLELVRRFSAQIDVPGRRILIPGCLPDFSRTVSQRNRTGNPQLLPRLDQRGQNFFLFF